MSIQNVRNSARNNWLLPGIAILAAQTEVEWQNQVLCCFCLRFGQANETGVVCVLYRQSWGCRGIEGFERGFGRDEPACPMPAKGNWDLWEVGTGGRLAALGAVVLGNSLSALCHACTEGLFYRVACRFPSRENAWVTGGTRAPAPSEGSSVVVWAPCSTSSASSVHFPPRLELSGCSLFPCWLLQDQLKDAITRKRALLLLQRWGVKRLSSFLVL